MFAGEFFHMKHTSANAALPFCGIHGGAPHFYAGEGEWVATGPRQFECKGPLNCAQPDYHYTKDACDPKKAAQL